MTFDNCQDERGNYKEFRGDLHFVGRLIAHDYDFEIDEAVSEQKTTFIHLYETEFDLFVLVIRDMHDYQMFLCDSQSEIHRLVGENVPYHRKHYIENFFSNVKTIFEDNVSDVQLTAYLKQKKEAFFNRRNHQP